MASPTNAPIRYLIVLFGDGAPLFFGPFNDNQHEALAAEARKQRRLFPKAKLAKLTIKSPKEMDTEPIE